MTIKTRTDSLDKICDSPLVGGGVTIHNPQELLTALVSPAWLLIQHITQPQCGSPFGSPQSSQLTQPPAQPQFGRLHARRSPDKRAAIADRPTSPPLMVRPRHLSRCLRHHARRRRAARSSDNSDADGAPPPWERSISCRSVFKGRQPCACDMRAAWDGVFDMHACPAAAI